MDAFYAAVEEQHIPRSAGGLVVIGADPKEGKGEESLPQRATRPESTDSGEGDRAS